jgi:heme/copper-type cytochrome/quinol oxidase subunit 2
VSSLNCYRLVTRVGSAIEDIEVSSSSSDNTLIIIITIIIAVVVLVIVFVLVLVVRYHRSKNSREEIGVVELEVRNFKLSL